MDTYQFDAAVYRSIRLPWLLLVLLLSFTVDTILIWIWQTGVSPKAKFYWGVGFAFLCFINLVFVKTVALYHYWHTKKMSLRSYVRLEKDVVVHYLLRTRMSHWQVNNLKQQSNGSIIIEGIIESKSLNEGWEEYNVEYGKAFVKKNKRYKIPAYYEGMDEIFQALKILK